MRIVKLSLLLLLCLAAASQLWSLPMVKSQSGGLAAPTGVTASDGAYTNKVGVNWDTMRNATGYRVYRNTTNDAATAESIGTTATASFFDTTAVASQTYFYWLRSENGGSLSGFSAPDAGLRASGPNNQGLNPPTAPAENPVTAAKVFLGKALFWDEQLSSTRTVACGTCHIGANGSSDPRSFGAAAKTTHAGADGLFGTADDIVGSMGVPLTLASGAYERSAQFGFKEQVTARRSMSAINAAYGVSLFWDGRALPAFKDPLTNVVVLATGGALESQALGPPVNSTEMAHQERKWSEVAARVMAAKPLALAPTVPAALAAWIGERGYPELFAEAFGSSEVTPVRIAMALATYQRTLYSDRTPFDVNDLTAAEARGLQVFNQNDCNDCHNAPLFTNNQFENTGVRPSAEDHGLFDTTNNQNDLGRFRTPSLRNVELRAPYMHNGRFKTLEEVVEFYNRGGDFPGSNTNRNRIRPRNLSAQQKSDLVAFMKRPLTDPRVAAESGPFDRPLLYAESMRVPQIISAGLAGAGGGVPQVTAIEPPIIGNPSFTVTVSNALGGAPSVLVIDRNDPGATPNIPGNAAFARIPVVLKGAGAGNGYASLSLTIPQNPALVGATLYGRWFVRDEAALGGVAVTPAFQMTIFGTVTSNAPAVASVSAASFAAGLVAPESIVTGFGANFSAATSAATTLPLPETLAGVTVAIRDVLGIERRAPLYFVSPNQINYQIPADTATGEGAVFIRQGGTLVGSGLLQISAVAPGLFTADANGRGVPAAVVLRQRTDSSQNYEPVARFNPATSRFEAVPIDLGSASDQLFLIGFGTGFRYRTALADVTALIGGADAEVSFAEAQGSLVGVDQVNLRIPRALAGRGNVDVALRVDGKPANTVTINVK